MNREPPAKSIAVVIPVFRDAPRAIEALHAVAAQALRSDWSREIILVDDGSGDATPRHLVEAATAVPEARVLRLPSNQGRSSARNAGARTASAELIVFMDCDCIPEGDGFLMAHADAFEAGAIAATGHVRGELGFWNRYQIEASRRRARQHDRGCVASGSSQNLSVDRHAFEAVGGFDAKYRRYGFEDRDLLARLSPLGRVAWLAEAVVRHRDRLELGGVVRKMRMAGGESAGRFAHFHPRLYRELGYARVDLANRRWAAPLARAGVFVEALADAADPLLGFEWLPYAFRRALVRGLSAAAFSCGTAGRRSGA